MCDRDHKIENQWKRQREDSIKRRKRAYATTNEHFMNS